MRCFQLHKWNESTNELHSELWFCAALHQPSDFGSAPVPKHWGPKPEMLQTVMQDLQHKSRAEVSRCRLHEVPSTNHVQTWVEQAQNFGKIKA